MKPRSIVAVLSIALGLTMTGATGAFAGSGQVAPGTATRPVLSTAEASRFTPAAYLGSSGAYSAPTADPWRPGDIPVERVRPDFVVGQVVGPVAGADRGAGADRVTHTSVQAAVNAAVLAGGTARRYIKILSGTYTGTVFIPAASPPLTIYGAGRPGDVRIEFSLDATVSPATWAQQVNPSGQYVPGDPAWDMYNSCATKTTATAALCATVVWAQSTDLRLRDLTITNTLLDTVNQGTHQALALRTDADRTDLAEVRLIGRQDTFYANANDPTQIARVSVRDSYIEGDTDFVFGRANAVFEHTEFHLVSTRKPANGVIFAPNTAPTYPYGFLVLRSRLTADSGYLAAPTGHFGRAWDQGASATGYIPGTTANGQLVIRDSVIGAGFDTVAPWSAAATTSRPYAGDIAADRDLNDVNYNRLWEYRNVGPGVAGVATG
jgi:pectinesterase